VKRCAQGESGSKHAATRTHKTNGTHTHTRDRRPGNSPATADKRQRRTSSTVILFAGSNWSILSSRSIANGLAFSKCAA
jgi:hypothetical protein